MKKIWVGGNWWEGIFLEVQNYNGQIRQSMQAREELRLDPFSVPDSYKRVPAIQIPRFFQGNNFAKKKKKNKKEQQKRANKNRKFGLFYQKN